MADAFRKYGVDMYIGGHGHSYWREDVSRWGDGVVHIMVGGAGNEEMRYPEDQFDPVYFPEPIMSAPQDMGGKSKMIYDMHAGHAKTFYDKCRQWCMSPEVRYSYEYMSSQSFQEDLANAGLITSKEFIFHSPEDFLLRVLGKNDNVDPCIHCGEHGNPEDPSPLVTNFNMALGKLDIDGNRLTWTLHRAPNGEILDQIVLQK